MKIALLGDIAPFGRYCLHNNPEALSQFDELRESLRGHDLVIGNLETPFVDGERAAGSKSAHIYAHPESIELLKYLGVTHVTLANNHIGDFGLAGFSRTKALLEKSGIGWFGAENRSLRLEVAAEKISLHGYCSLNTNPASLRLGKSEMLNILDVDRVTLAMERDRRDGYLSILAVHSGQEHVHMPSSEDVEFARGLALQFDYIYYGHHPHVVQGAEKVESSLLFYSLGNCVFDDVYTARDNQRPLVRLSEANRTGVIATVEISNGQVGDWSLAPIYLGSDRVSTSRNVRGFEMCIYNSLLAKAGTDQYEKNRSKAIWTYIGSRRALRDLKWYWSRLNMNSIGIIWAARRNAIMHHAVFTSKLSKLKGPR